MIRFGFIVRALNEAAERQGSPRPPVGPLAASLSVPPLSRPPHGDQHHKSGRGGTLIPFVGSPIRFW